MSRALLLAVGVLAAAAPAAAAAPVSRHVLDNGFTVLVRPDDGASVVAASLMVRAGTLFETADTAGITNFLHRAMVRGAGGRSAQALAEAAEDLGGVIDASGDVEHAEIRGTALAYEWRALLRLVADVALAPTLAVEEVERERVLIHGELGARADAPFQRALDALFAELFTGHPYAWHAAGRRETVARLTRNDLVAHHRATYRPDRMVLAVAGKVPPDRVLRTATGLFGGMPRPPVGATPPTAVATPAGGRLVLERPAQQAQVLVGYLAPSIHDAHYAATRVLAAILGGGMASRLFVELRDRRGLAYSLGVLQGFRTGPGFFLAYLGTSPRNVDTAVRGVLDEIERIRAVPVSERELARAKAYLQGTLALDRRTSARHAWYLGFFEVVGAGWEFPDRYREAIDAVTVGDVTRAAARVLDRATIVVLRPPAGPAR